MLRRLWESVGSSATEACSFCSRSREEVAALVAGPGASICDACVPLCLAILDERPEVSSPFQHLVQCCAAELEGQGLSDGDRDRLAEAAMLLAGAVPGALRVVAIASISRAPDVARRAFEAIPSSERTSADAINHAVALYNCGSFADALVILDATIPSDPVEDAVRTLGRVAVRLRLEPRLEDDVLRHLLLQLDEAAACMGGLHRVPLAGNRAECLIRLGQLRDARRLLSVIADEESEPIHHMLLGDIHLARGERAEAVERYRAASATRSPLRPELEGRMARVGLQSPFR